MHTLKLFDSHLHIIDPRFPLIANHGYLPPTFTSHDYLHSMQAYNLQGGAIVSGSFQGFDQTYLLDALQTLGTGFVGVTQLPANVSDAELLHLHQAGVRAIRFNLKRGGSEEVTQLDYFARRVHELVGWHAELYVDSGELDTLYPTLVALPAVSIDHLGLTKAGFKTLLKLVESGVHVKATGFGRVDFDALTTMQAIMAINPDALMFGTDLPSTRAPRPYSRADYQLILDNFDTEAVRKIFHDNAYRFYLCANTSLPTAL